MKMPEIAEDTLSKMEELLEHIDLALAWIINYAGRHRIELDAVAQFHVRRIETLLHEINEPFTKRITQLDSGKLPPDNATEHPGGGVRDVSNSNQLSSQRFS